jgi:hypothetical protein
MHKRLKPASFSKDERWKRDRFQKQQNAQSGSWKRETPEDRYHQIVVYAAPHLQDYKVQQPKHHNLNPHRRENFISHTIISNF